MAPTREKRETTVKEGADFRLDPSPYGDEAKRGPWVARIAALTAFSPSDEKPPGPGFAKAGRVAITPVIDAPASTPRRDRSLPI